MIHLCNRDWEIGSHVGDKFLVITRSARHVVDIVDLNINLAVAADTSDADGSILFGGAGYHRSVFAFEGLGFNDVVFFGFGLGGLVRFVLARIRLHADARAALAIRILLIGFRRIILLRVRRRRDQRRYAR